MIKNYELKNHELKNYEGYGINCEGCGKFVYFKSVKDDKSGKKYTICQNCGNHEEGFVDEKIIKVFSNVYNDDFFNKSYKKLFKERNKLRDDLKFCKLLLKISIIVVTILLVYIGFLL